MNVILAPEKVKELKLTPLQAAAVTTFSRYPSRTLKYVAKKAGTSITTLNVALTKVGLETKRAAQRRKNRSDVFAFLKKNPDASAPEAARSLGMKVTIIKPIFARLHKRSAVTLEWEKRQHDYRVNPEEAEAQFIAFWEGFQRKARRAGSESSTEPNLPQPSQTIYGLPNNPA